MTSPPPDADSAALLAPGAQFEMRQTEIDGIDQRVWLNAPPTLRDILETSRVRTGDFIVYDSAAPGAIPGQHDRLSYDEHWHAVCALAHSLVDDLGVDPGDRVAIAMRNLPEWSIAFWAATAVGAIVVPLNAWWTADELAFGLADSSSVLVFADDERAQRISERTDQLPNLRTTVVARGSSPGAVAFDELLERRADSALPDVTCQPDDDATIFYTSGTTGRPKGALGTHRNICTNLVNLEYCAARAALRDGGMAQTPSRNVYLLSVPFFHVTGCHSVLVSNLAAGNTIVLMHRWDPRRALDLIEAEQVTSLGGVPTVAWQLLEQPDLAERDLSSVRGISYGGAPAAPQIIERLRTAIPVAQPAIGYGLTETSSVVSMNSGSDYVARPDSVGVPVPVCDVRIVADGSDVAAGEVGEVIIRGPNVIRGYWQQPEATNATFRHGWLHTGDLGRVDDEGFLYIVDRAKDVIIRGGENIYCSEVEAALFSHPDVADAAAVALPHAALGEEVGAVVHLVRSSSLGEHELRAHLATKLASFKVPVEIVLTDLPLPRNANGKILRRELRGKFVRDRSS